VLYWCKETEGRAECYIGVKRQKEGQSVILV
jgi:hypothetical protein